MRDGPRTCPRRSAGTSNTFPAFPSGYPTKNLHVGELAMGERRNDDAIVITSDDARGGKWPEAGTGKRDFLPMFTTMVGLLWPGSGASPSSPGHEARSRPG